MKRTFEVNFPENIAQGYRIGDDAAHRAAAALADRVDAPTLQLFADITTILEGIGGQFYVTSVRAKQETGEFLTVSLIADYETRDARIEYLEPPTEVHGIPITDSAQAATALEAVPEQDPGPEPPAPEPRAPEDGGVRDEIEAEVDADLEPAPAA